MSLSRLIHTVKNSIIKETKIDQIYRTKYPRFDHLLFNFQSTSKNENTSPWFSLILYVLFSASQAFLQKNLKKIKNFSKFSINFNYLRLLSVIL